MGKIPAFQFYPGDWLKDPALAVCSPAARGVWIDVLCLMYESPRPGYLVTNGKPWTVDEIAAAVRGDRRDNLRLISELISRGVMKQNKKGIFFNSRMVRDEVKRGEWRGKNRRNYLKTKKNSLANSTSIQPASSSSSSSSLSSQDHLSLEGEEDRTAAAAAFRSLESEPYGPVLFQKAWAHEFAAPPPPCTCGGRHRCASCKTNGFVDSMERTIQICQRNGVTVPGRFYAHKKEIEKSEATALYRRDPQ